MRLNVVEKPMTEYLYSLYGTSLRCLAESSHLAESVQGLLSHFQRDSLEEEAVITIHLHAVSDRSDIPLALSASARQLSAGTGGAVADRRATGLPYEVLQDGGRLVADFRDAGALIMNSVQGMADVYLVKPESMQPSLIEYLFHTALIELLRRRGLYTIHATALEKHGRAVLIPGNSGRGKTTSFISLLRSGYRYLSDDHPLIRDMGTSVDVLPFPVKVNVTEATISFFPELRDAPPTVLRPGVPKRSFRPEDLYETSMGEPCQPALVLFPNVVDTPHSHLELLPKSRALEVLLPQALLVYDQEVAKRGFQVLAKLVQQVDCYRLHFGRDILDLPKLITPLLERERG